MAVPADAGLGPVVSILTWLFTVTMFLSVLARLGIRLAGSGTRWLEDGSICVSAILCIAQCAIQSVAVTDGLGKQQRYLTDGQVRDVHKLQFTSDVLFLPTMLTAQASLLFLIESIPASKTLRKVIRSINISNLAWTAPVLLTLVIVGAVTHNWLYMPTCINFFAFWVVSTVFIILIEVSTMILPWLSILPMKAPLSRKATIVVSFSFRAFVVGGLIVRLYFLTTTSSKDSDSTYHLASYAIASQAVLCLAITTASIPILSRFLEKFETGMLNIRNINPEPGRSFSFGGLITAADQPSDGSCSKQSSLIPPPSRRQARNSRSHSRLHGSFSTTHREDQDIVVTTEVHVQNNELDEVNPLPLRQSFESSRISRG